MSASCGNKRARPDLDAEDEDWMAAANPYAGWKEGFVAVAIHDDVYVSGAPQIPDGKTLSDVYPCPQKPEARQQQQQPCSKVASGSTVLKNAGFSTLADEAIACLPPNTKEAVVYKVRVTPFGFDGGGEANPVCDMDAYNALWNSVEQEALPSPGAYPRRADQCQNILDGYRMLKSKDLPKTFLSDAAYRHDLMVKRHAKTAPAFASCFYAASELPKRLKIFVYKSHVDRMLRDTTRPIMRLNNAAIHNACDFFQGVK